LSISAQVKRYIFYAFSRTERQFFNSTSLLYMGTTAW